MENIKFGTDGWRAVIADEFTFKNLGVVVAAIARYLKKEKKDKAGIAIGYDNRFLSEDFAWFSAKVLSDNNIKSFISDSSIPTPLTAFLVLDLILNGGIMITASHNPSIYNGIKFIPFYGGPAGDNITKQIEENIRENTSSNDLLYNKTKENNSSHSSNIKVIKDYTKYKRHLSNILNMDLIRKVRPLVAIDTMFGAGSKILPEILNSDLNLEAVVYNDYRDCLFGGSLPDPSEKNLSSFRETILKNNLDIGLALDGDADRFGIIDGKGVYISPNNAISIILNFMIETRSIDTGDIAVRTVATTHLIDDICASNNIEMLETPVGFKHIAEAMRKGNVIVGGEESGGLSIKGHIPEKDGILACLKILEIQSFLNKKTGTFYISDYLNNIYEKYGYYHNIRLDIEVSQKRKPQIIKYFLSMKNKDIENVKVKKIVDIDGAKLIFENKSWLLVRASGTEPLIRCYIESRDQAFFEKLKKFARNKIK